MTSRKDALFLVYKNVVESFGKFSFTSDVNITEDGDNAYIDFVKNDLTVRLSSHDNVVDLLEKLGDAEFSKVSTNLYELADADEKEAKSIANEIIEQVEEKYNEKQIHANAQKKAPATVSKSAVRAGMTYDANTLANKLTAIYPELKEPFKDNFQTYGEFLSEEFFTQHANKYILGTIKSGDYQTRKKLFKILSDIYLDGSSDVQDLIGVTILGEINNDKEMLETCCEFIEDKDFYDTVVAINQILSGRSGKKLREKMDNPPKYRPKKAKKGFMSNMLDASQMQQNNR
ncbi:MAG: hypothetical protein K5761_01000 [Clostridiales bacterium]|nr:hypothetical protein [Clostridiales bacterium]